MSKSFCTKGRGYKESKYTKTKQNKANVTPEEKKIYGTCKQTKNAKMIQVRAISS